MHFPNIIMNRGLYLPLGMALIVGAVGLPLRKLAAQAPHATRPNVVLILADDLGWSDTSLFQTTTFYRTPNIERLAQRGMTFSRAYASSPLCSPTRASILTGLSPARTGITSPNCHLPKIQLTAEVGTKAKPGDKAIIPESVTRLSTDYYTLAEALHDHGYATGHFGKWHLGAEPYSPLEHGFDVDVPHWHGPGPAGSYVAPWKFTDFDPQTPDEHIEDRMATEVVAFMESHRQQPFFLNYWMFSVHAPFNAKQSLIDEYRQRIDPESPQRSPTYAAMIESMDDAVGTLLDTLDRLQIANNTIIVFCSDNGGNMYNEVDGTTATSNHPLRGGKATMYEGGIRTPAIIAYPEKVSAGSRSQEVIQSSDYYPTLLELLDIQPQAGQRFDGISLVPALRGEPLGREAIFTYFPHQPNIPDWMPPAVSVHHGDWKLIRVFHAGEKGLHAYKLFQLSDDPAEQTNLAERFPERVAQLDALIEDFLIETQAVRPVPNLGFDPAHYHPELEGQAPLKGSKPAEASDQTPAPQRAARPAKRGPAVAGWQPAGTCTLSLSAETLHIDSSGGDPHISFTLPTALPAGTIRLEFSMTSTSSGAGQVYWQEQGVAPAFAKERSVSFSPKHDSQPHTYTVELLPQNRVLAVRLDPSSGKGQIQIHSMQLLTTDGSQLYRWTFRSQKHNRGDE
jgi:arylsulfatase A-like enzyme